MCWFQALLQHGQAVNALGVLKVGRFCAQTCFQLLNLTLRGLVLKQWGSYTPSGLLWPYKIPIPITLHLWQNATTDVVQKGIQMRKCHLLKPCKEYVAEMPTNPSSHPWLSGWGCFLHAALGMLLFLTRLSLGLGKEAT